MSEMENEKITLKPEQLVAMFKEIQCMNNASLELFSISQQEDSRKNQKDGFILPAAVLSAFTCELCIKSILCMDGDELRTGHNLKSLFKLLNPEYKSNIKKNTLNFITEKFKLNTPINFNKELKSIALSFQNLRYFYEKIEPPKGHLVNIAFLDSFKFALIQQFAEVENKYAARINSNNKE